MWREPTRCAGSLHIFLYSKGTPSWIPSWIRSQSILRLSAPLQLAKAGIYPYAEHPDFDLLLFGYAVDGGPVEVVDLASRQIWRAGGGLKVSISIESVSMTVFLSNREKCGGNQRPSVKNADSQQCSKKNELDSKPVRSCKQKPHTCK
jgi:hypothetical protein